ncbi:MAG: cupredoxin domain-containing protein [Alphaproteobacteria bacterium]|nr:cupredoxin domain-containing protein [Alphaproteobacteria bacterium]
MKPRAAGFLLVIASVMAVALPAHAEDVVETQLTLTNHTFAPQELAVPADKKIKLTVVNKDASTAEFESDDLGREKVVPANGQIYVYIGPLDPGTYGYYDDFHRETTTGKIIAK